MPAATRKGSMLWAVAVVVAAVILTALHLGAAVDWIGLDRLSRFVAFEPFQHRLLVPALVAGGLVLWPQLQPLVLYAAVETIFWIACLLLASHALRLWVPSLPISARRLLAFTVAWPVAIHLVKPQSFELLHADGTLCRVEALDLNFAHIHLTPNLYYPYDLPGAVFVLLLLVLAWHYRQDQRPRWIALYGATLVAATFNRESVGLMVLALAVMLPRRPLARYWSLLASHVAIVAAVGWLAARLVAATAARNPLGTLAGGAYETHLVNNIRTLVHPLYLVWVVPLFAGGLWAALLTSRRSLAADLGRLLLAFVIPSIVVALVFGQVLESRVFIEVQPVLWIAAVQALAGQRAGVTPATR